MKILAIRGRNLASLYGPFELRLDGGPIAETGLFSISGPTGAGKSTIMDALCLALYGRTPRLSERRRSVMVGRPGDDGELVDANDVRAILSRGEVEAYAEVEFEAVDDRTYRARWSVNRARRRSDGKLQQAQMVLMELSGAGETASGLREVPERVEALTGYKFDDFKRAVLLPQFEFMAFLEAAPAERGVILERVTGTDIYTKLSVATHERAKREAESLEGIDARARSISMLTEPERREQLQRAEELEREHQLAEAAGKAAALTLSWHTVAEALERDAAEAASAHARALEQGNQAEPIRLELGAVDEVQALRAPHEEVARTVRDWGEANARRDEAKSSLEAASVERERSDQACHEAEAATAVASERLSATRPELDQARALDAAIADSRRRADAASAESESVSRAAAQAHCDFAELRRQMLDCETQHRRASDWLEQHARHRPLTEEWPRWKAKLGEHASIASDLARVEEALRTSREKAGACERRKATLEAKARGLEATFTKLKEQAREARDAIASDDLRGLKKREAELSDRTKALAELVGLAEQAASARKARAEAEEARRADEEAARTARTRSNGIDRELAAGQGKLDGEQQALDRIRAALGMEEHRADLVEGEPCPLCGAPNHPYAAKRKAPTQSLRVQQEGAVAAAKKEIERLTKENMGEEKKVARLETRIEEKRQEEARQDAATDKAQQKYGKRRDGAAIQGIPARAADACEKLSEMEAVAQQELSAAQKEHEQAIARKEAADKARESVEAARVELEGVRTELQAVNIEAGLGAKDLERLGADGRSLKVRRDGVEGELDPVLSFRTDWRGAAREAPAAFSDECANLVAEFTERLDEQQKATEERAGLEASISTAGAVAQERDQRVGEHVRLAGEAAKERDELVRRRGDLLRGREAGAVEQELTGAEAMARRRAGEERQRASLAAQAHARAEQTVATAAERATEAECALTAARGVLSVGLVKHGVDEPRLQELLSRDQAWINTARQQLDALDREMHKSGTLRRERERKLEEHRASGRPTMSREDAALQGERAVEQVRRAAAELTEVKVRLRADDERQAESKQLAAEREAKQVIAEKWGRLAKLIGAADGKKFRTFAQGLTFDALLQHAGQHLQCLAPRYGLMRVPNADLDLQVVDHDLGDDVRSVNGLSGGETFLVSLALALGLSSLSTRATYARTLFIDEGFGTLDRDTLENAMEALERLRAAGRTIGVISHLPELHDRIGVQVAVERTSAGRSRVIVPQAIAGP